MNITHYTFDFTAQISQISLSSMPMTFWDYYLRYLWFYEPDSWVARIANTCRVLAVLVSLPVVILLLLDVSSYILARTLGVVDDVKASTSDKETVHSETKEVPVIRVQEPFEDSSFSSDSGLGSSADHPVDVPPAVTVDENQSQPTLFFTGGDDNNNLKLSGVGVFSPAVSRPPSPATTRKQLHTGGKEQIRHRTHR